MADQKKITLRQGHATPKNIILNELPVATSSAGTTIYLYEGHATAKNIILRDPTVLVSQGAASYEITAASSAIVLSGSSVILAFGRVILASTSAIALAASSVSLRKGYSLSATSSAIALSGSSAVLQFGRKISATSSAITLAGSSAGLTVNRNISAVSSAIVLSGSTVTLTYTPVVSSYEIEAVSSAIALAGSSVDLVYTPAVAAIARGGAWLDESQVREYEREKKRRRGIEREIEETITLAYQRLTGKITPPLAVIEAKGEPEKLAVAADKIATQLVLKANKSDKFKARNRAIIADLKRLAREITEADALALQIEEEAIVFLLAA
jgi:hypothetical protein